MNLQKELEKILEIAFAEDIGSGDITGNSVIPENAAGEFVFKTRDDIVFCGVDVIKSAFGNSEIFAEDGAFLKAGSEIALISGNVQEILRNERTLLNLIQILSGISTETAKYVEAIEGTKAKILDTRKTIPGLRLLSKYAVKCGGGRNHRMGLYDMVMIKDNHIAAAGGIKAAVEKARRAGLKIEVECDNFQQVKEAVEARVDIILADNMPNADLRKVVEFVDGRIPVEASGNISLGTVKSVAETGVDFISTSKITMGVKAVDIGLDEVIG